MDELPDVAISLPLGAGRLTRARLLGDPPSPDDVRAARRYVRAEVGRVVRDVVRQGSPDQVVGTSKTFRSLARVCGMVATEVDSGSGTLAAAATSATSGSGGAVAGGGGATHRVLKLDDLASWVPKLAEMTLAQRADLPGVSISRAAQLLAGALVAEASMELLGVEQLQICPWALREGVILRRLDLIAASNGG
jgi:exopolyphosphatase/guanosine-5'-triphosphate,3'-diphosphate pyrophosphatase